jgi:hypothetical protein
MIELFVGQRQPSLVYTFTVGGVPKDMTGETVTLKIRPLHAATVITETVVPVLAASGQFRWDPSALAVATAGDFVGWFHAEPSTQESDEFPIVIKAHADSTFSNVNLSNLRQHVETGMDDTALQRILDDAAQEVLSRFGTDASRTVRLNGTGRSTVRLVRPALTLTSVAEYNSQGTLLYTLAGTDYELQNDGRTIRRLTGGLWASGYWSYTVQVIYTPQPELALRDRVIIDLVRLACSYSAQSSEKIGDYQANHVDYLNERERLLQAVKNRRGFSFA